MKVGARWSLEIQRSRQRSRRGGRGHAPHLSARQALRGGRSPDPRERGDVAGIVAAVAASSAVAAVVIVVAIVVIAATSPRTPRLLLRRHGEDNLRPGAR